MQKLRLDDLEYDEEICVYDCSFCDRFNYNCPGYKPLREEYSARIFKEIAKKKRKGV